MKTKEEEEGRRKNKKGEEEKKQCQVCRGKKIGRKKRKVTTL